ITGSNVLNRLPPHLSQFDAPATVRASASRPASGNEITLHFVNYNRDEPPDKSQSGFKYEKPIPARGFRANFRLPPGFSAHRIEFLTPENEQPQPIKFQEAGRHLRLTVPEFLVYGV